MGQVDEKWTNDVGTAMCPTGIQNEGGCPYVRVDRRVERRGRKEKGATGEWLSSTAAEIAFGRYGLCVSAGYGQKPAATPAVARKWKSWGWQIPLRSFLPSIAGSSARPASVPVSDRGKLLSAFSQ